MPQDVFTARNRFAEKPHGRALDGRHRCARTMLSSRVGNGCNYVHSTTSVQISQLPPRLVSGAVAFLCSCRSHKKPHRFPRPRAAIVRVVVRMHADCVVWSPSKCELPRAASSFAIILEKVVVAPLEESSRHCQSWRLKAGCGSLRCGGNMQIFCSLSPSPSIYYNLIPKFNEKNCIVIISRNYCRYLQKNSVFFC